MMWGGCGTGDLSTKDCSGSFSTWLGLIRSQVRYPRLSRLIIENPVRAVVAMVPPVTLQTSKYSVFCHKIIVQRGWNYFKLIRCHKLQLINLKHTSTLKRSYSSIHADSSNWLSLCLLWKHFTLPSGPINPAHLLPDWNNISPLPGKKKRTQTCFYLIQVLIQSLCLTSALLFLIYLGNKNWSFLLNLDIILKNLRNVMTAVLFTRVSIQCESSSTHPPLHSCHFRVIWFQWTTLPTLQITRKQEKNDSHMTWFSSEWQRVHRKTLTQKNMVWCGGDLSPGALWGPIDTISDTVPPLHSTALTNALLLFLLFYECCRPEERDSADFPDSQIRSPNRRQRTTLQILQRVNRKQHDFTAQLLCECIAPQQLICREGLKRANYWRYLFILFIKFMPVQRRNCRLRDISTANAGASWDDITYVCLSHTLSDHVALKSSTWTHGTWNKLVVFY